MVMAFFRKGDSGLDHVVARTVSMLADARHSFDLASGTVLSGADVNAATIDVEETDARINQAEQELRGQLVVHVTVQGTDDIGEVLGSILLIKRIERIGDQARNVLSLAQEGVDLSGEPDNAELVTYRRTISRMMARAADVIAEHGHTETDTLREEAYTLQEEFGSRIIELMRSDRPGHEAVPRAILYRYWGRIVANVAGVVSMATEPLTTQDYEDGGAVDIDD